LLTTFGIAVGVAAVVALGALADGFIEGYAALAGGSGADLLVVQDDALDIVFSAVDEKVGPILAGLSGVEEVSEMIYTFAGTDDAPYFIVYGYRPDGFAIEHFKIVEGQSLGEARGTRGKPCLLGQAADGGDGHLPASSHSRAAEGFAVRRGQRALGHEHQDRPCADAGVEQVEETPHTGGGLARAGWAFEEDLALYGAIDERELLICQRE